MGYKESYMGNHREAATCHSKSRFPAWRQDCVQGCQLCWICRNTYRNFSGILEPFKVLSVCSYLTVMSYNETVLIAWFKLSEDFK